MVCISVCMWQTGRVQREGCSKAQRTCQSLYGAQRAMLQHHGPQHGKTWGRWVQCSSTTSPLLLPNVRQQWWEWHSVRGSLGSWPKQKSCWRGIWGLGESGSWKLFEGGFGEAVGGAGILQWRGKASPPVTSLWNPSAGARAQGGVAAWPSAWADRQSPHWATVQLALPGPFPPRLAKAYGSQAADPQWTGRSPALLSPISKPPLGSKQQQHPLGRETLQKWIGRGGAPLPHSSSCTQAAGWWPSRVCCWW